MHRIPPFMYHEEDEDEEVGGAAQAAHEAEFRNFVEDGCIIYILIISLIINFCLLFSLIFILNNA